VAGKFRIPKLKEGTFRLDVHGEPQHSSRKVSGVRAGRSDVVVGLTTTPVITGQVVDGSGRGYEGRFLLRAYDGNGKLTPATITRWSRGRFSLTGLARGTYVLRVRSLDEPGLAGEGTAKTGDVHVRIQLR
jgi:hypothetical protein